MVNSKTSNQPSKGPRGPARNQGDEFSVTQPHLNLPKLKITRVLPQFQLLADYNAFLSPNIYYAASGRAANGEPKLQTSE